MTAKRSIRLASFLKAEGMRRGCADLFLPVMRGKWGGLFIEMKAEGGIISDYQREFAHAMRRQGYAVVFAWCAADAIQIIVKYLSGAYA